MMGQKARYSAAETDVSPRKARRITRPTAKMKRAVKRHFQKRTRANMRSGAATSKEEANTSWN